MLAQVQIDEAIAHWGHVAPLLTAPKSEADYEQLVQVLDSVLDAGGADENHSLAGLADSLSDLIEEWESKHHAMPPAASGVEVLRFLMQEHNIKQTELPEIGTQSVVSEVLNGKRQLNVHHIARLSARFGVSADLFIDKE
jgi:HTH-type transcriptional regulator/antitoxin HigA